MNFYLSIGYCVTVTLIRILQVQVFWAVTMCGVVIGYQRFVLPCCLHLWGG
jgi:hypothetical protein